MKSRVHIIIGGRVQGVGFRFSCQNKARELALAGWVKNRSDGKVETVAEGSKEAIEQYIQWCRHGPRSAGVTEIESKSEEPVNQFDNFRITF
jgi:acylphosphatase